MFAVNLVKTDKSVFPPLFHLYRLLRKVKKTFIFCKYPNNYPKFYQNCSSLYFMKKLTQFFGSFFPIFLEIDNVVFPPVLSIYRLNFCKTPFSRDPKADISTKISNSIVFMITILSIFCRLRVGK